MIRWIKHRPPWRFTAVTAIPSLLSSSGWSCRPGPHRRTLQKQLSHTYTHKLYMCVYVCVSEEIRRQKLPIITHQIDERIANVEWRTTRKRRRMWQLLMKHEKEKVFDMKQSPFSISLSLLHLSSTDTGRRCSTLLVACGGNDVEGARCLCMCMCERVRVR